MSRSVLQKLLHREGYGFARAASVIKRHRGRFIGTAEVPFKADRIAAPQLTRKVCQDPPWRCFASMLPGTAACWYHSCRLWAMLVTTHLLDGGLRSGARKCRERSKVG